MVYVCVCKQLLKIEKNVLLVDFECMLLFETWVYA